MQPDTMEEAGDSDRKRLAWQCRRGMRELDEILGAFMAAGYGRLDETGRTQFSKLLEYPDAVLLEILMGRMAAADTAVAHIVQKIRGSLAP